VSVSPLGSHVPIPIEPAAPAKRVLLLTHRSPEVTASGLPVILSILEEAGLEVLVPAAEVVKHRILAPYQSSDGKRLNAGARTSSWCWAATAASSGRWHARPARAPRSSA